MNEAFINAGIVGKVSPRELVQVLARAVLPTADHFSIDIFGARQDDARSSPSHVNALGLTRTMAY